jgi:hypothetical protein
VQLWDEERRKEEGGLRRLKAGELGVHGWDARATFSAASTERVPSKGGRKSNVEGRR